MKISLQKFIVVLIAALLLIPLPLVAAPHVMADGKVMLGGMEVGGAMQKLPEQTVDGIKAIAHLKDVKVALAKMKMPQTHHLLITFVDIQSSKEIVPESAAVKVVEPTGRASEPIELLVMPRHVGADITLASAGDYRFKVAAKLPGGKTLHYEFNINIK